MVKGIAIILMVIGHAECPGLLMNFIYLFHMPVFFIAAGYFFSSKDVDNPWNFCCKRFKGLYVPFVKWSILFLILHNLFFAMGIMNEQYGNWSGGVTHPYSFKTAMIRLTSIIFSMGGYDEFLLGAFWFFRALLIASILFLVLYRFIGHLGKDRLSHPAIAGIIVVAALLFAVLKISCHIRISTVVQGGIRETWGVAFYGIGVLYRHYEAHIRENWASTLSIFVLLSLDSYYHLKGMNLSPRLLDVATLPVTGTIGFLMLHQISMKLDAGNGIAKRFLVYCGNHTMAVYVFHIISFKLVSVLKIWWYGLDFAQIGCHMVIHEHNGDLFWILYTIVGVGIPLIWKYCYDKFKERLCDKRIYSI